jgi:hypothetical protein
VSEQEESRYRIANTVSTTGERLVTIYRAGDFKTPLVQIPEDQAAERMFAAESELELIRALIAIRKITEATHIGTKRAHTALSLIDQVVRKALA